MVVRLPNVGKSTLLNQILGQKLVAVSSKPQTTRNRILGVKNLPGAQIVLVDTPGLQRGRGALRKYMREQALAAASEADVALVLIDASDKKQRSLETMPAEDRADLEAVTSARTPAVLALNKVDKLADKKVLLPIIDAYAHSGRFAEVVPISALSGDGVDALLSVLAAHLPEGERLFPEEMITDRAERFLAAELIREQLFHQLGDELPYASAVVIEQFEERRDRADVVIHAIVFVERESQKGIVVGRAGARVKEVGQRARAEIGRLLGCPVHLKLLVKVAEGWSQGEGGLRRMGYDE